MNNSTVRVKSSCQEKTTKEEVRWVIIICTVDNNINYSSQLESSLHILAFVQPQSNSSSHNKFQPNKDKAQLAKQGKFAEAWSWTIRD